MNVRIFLKTDEVTGRCKVIGFESNSFADEKALSIIAEAIKTESAEIRVTAKGKKPYSFIIEDFPHGESEN